MVMGAENAVRLINYVTKIENKKVNFILQELDV